MEEQNNPLPIQCAFITLDPLYEFEFSEEAIKMIENRCSKLTMVQTFLYLKRILTAWQFAYLCYYGGNYGSNPRLLKHLNLEHLVDRRYYAADNE